MNMQYRMMLLNLYAKGMFKVKQYPLVLKLCCVTGLTLGLIWFIGLQLSSGRSKPETIINDVNQQPDFLPGDNGMSETIAFSDQLQGQDEAHNPKTSKPQNKATPAFRQQQRTTLPINRLTDVYRAVGEVRAFDKGHHSQRASGTGTGFIIDPSGIMVTNVHVIGEAAFVEVRLARTDDWLSARVVAVNECQDLAILDIEGDEYDYLEWSSAPVEVGLTVYASGFPRQAEYTLTEGIISRDDSNGDTDWASLNRVLVTTAHIKPGNSGGPLVNQRGQVVGVNYAGNETIDLNVAIPGDIAQETITYLQEEGDQQSIGISGQAINYGDGRQGILVNAVRSGTPADEAGLQTGDVIVFMEDRLLAEDGTMNTFCKILKSRTQEDVLDVVVWRQAEIERLDGQINGRALRENGNSILGWGYEVISDQEEIVTLVTPTRWLEHKVSTRILLDSIEALHLNIAPNLSSFWDTWVESGISINVWPNPSARITNQDLADLLNQFSYANACTYEGRDPYSTQTYSGYADVWRNCDRTPTVFMTFALKPENEDYFVFIQAQLVEDADFRDINLILNTMQVDFGGSIVDESERGGSGRDSVSQSRSSGQSPTPTPTPIPMPMPTPRSSSSVTAQVQINRLNVRSGPGVDYPVVDSVKQNQVLNITGKSRQHGCSWLQFDLTDGAEGWVFADYLALEGSCDDIPTVAVDSPPTEGCYHFTNHRDTALTITITPADGKNPKDFQVPSGGTQTECFPLGKATYTISTPWDAVSGEITINLGTRYYKATMSGLPKMQ